MEMKRVELTSVQSPQKQKKVQRKKNTYRFNITLGESNATTCPEYSFADLIKNQRGASDEPFDSVDDDSDVVALAQRFEAKYGSKALRAGKKKWTQEMDDYYDLGEGYDEDDPFIDNTEAYDEVVPSTLTTKHGGFYMNRGKLDFKSLHEDSGDEIIDSPSVKKTKKKRVINSDSEGGDFEETGEALTKKFKAMKRKKLLESKENEKKKRKQVFGPDGELVIKKRKKKNLEKLKNMPERTSTPQEPVPLSTPTNAPPPEVSPLSAASAAAVEMATPKTPIVTNGTSSGDHETAAKDFHASLEETFNAILQETFKDDSSSKSGEEFKADHQLSENNTQLPSQLPIELAEAIDNIKKEAKDNKEGKVKFFSADINKLLLDIELGCKNLPWGRRKAIYKHLSEHLPCGFHALQRRAKKLTAGQQEDQLKVLAQKLKEAIMREMPALEEQHEQDVARAKQEAEIKEENPETVKEEASTESEEEEKTESSKRKPRGPRRKFQWTQGIKELLLDVVTVKMKLYSTCKTRNQTAEEYLKAYLDADIKTIWPQGWMQTRTLFKESRAAHEEMTKGTNQQAKQKKNLTVQSSTPSSDISQVIAQETGRTHVSKIEDVIEITDDRTETVVVNLPNSDMKPLSALTIGGQAKVPELSQGDILVSGGRGGKFVPPTSTPPWVVLQQTNVVNLSTPVTTKRITPTPVSDSSYTSAAPSSPRTTSAPKLLAPGGSMSGLQEGVNSTSSSGNCRSFLTAFQNFTNTYTQLDTLPSQTQSNQKFGNSFQDPTSSKGASESGQQKAAPGSQPKTISLLQPGTPPQQKAAVKTSSYSEVVNMDIPNSSWSSVSSVVTPGKCVSPVVSVPRLTSTSPSSIATLIDKESNARLSQVIQKKIQQQQEKQQGKQQSLVDNFKSVHNVPSKKRQLQSPGPLSSVVKSNDFLFKSALNDKNSSSFPNSKVDILQKQQNMNPGFPTSPNTSLSKATSASNNHLKTATILGSSSGSGTNMQPLTGILLGANTKSSQQIANNLPQSKGNKLSSVQKLYSQTSPPKPQKASIVSNSSPLNQSLLLQSSPLLPQSRGSTPSPQKSPMSPETPSLSLYEQIQSQIRNQDAMEGKALQNLALAMNSSNSVLRGLKPATVRKASEWDSIKYTSKAFESHYVAPTNGPPERLPVQKSAVPVMLNTMQPDIQFRKNLFKTPCLAIEKQSGTLNEKETHNIISKEKPDGRLSGHFDNSPGGSNLGIHLTMKNDTSETYLKKFQQISVLTMQSKETAPKLFQKPQAGLDSKQKFKEPFQLCKIVAPPLAKMSSHDLDSSSSFVKSSLSITMEKPKKIKTEIASVLTKDGGQLQQNSPVSTKLASSLQEAFTKFASHLPEISERLNLPEKIEKNN